MSTGSKRWQEPALAAVVAAALWGGMFGQGIAQEKAAPVKVGPYATDSPLGLMHQFVAAYQGMLLEDYGALLASDFRFYFGDPDLEARYPEGWGREDEIAAAEHLFHGFTNARGERMPAARRIELSLDSLEVEPDPGRPDSAAWYERVVVPSVTLRVTFEGGAYFVERQRHEFRLVRGDAARLTPGQPADPDHWYVRGWIEGRPRALPGDRETVGGGATAEAAAPTAFLLESIRPNPTSGPFEVRFTLPAEAKVSLRVVDVAGRIRMAHDLGILGPGEHRITLGRGAVPTPGVYWVRLSVGSRAVSSCLVVQ